MVAAILAAAGFGVYSLWNHRDLAPNPFQNMSMEKLTSTGKVKMATVSADGQYVFNVQDDVGGRASHVSPPLPVPVAVHRRVSPVNRTHDRFFPKNGQAK